MKNIVIATGLTIICLSIQATGSNLNHFKTVQYGSFSTKEENNDSIVKMNQLEEAIKDYDSIKNNKFYCLNWKKYKADNNLRLASIRSIDTTITNFEDIPETTWVIQAHDNLQSKKRCCITLLSCLSLHSISTYDDFHNVRNIAEIQLALKKNRLGKNDKFSLTTLQSIYCPVRTISYCEQNPLLDIK
ncbi:MAG: hypothetical protein JO129_03030 [Candidatus Dependentiae bacterium]|nr:hypothetical protein [Candidatus Dependentiae bacterium]